MPKRSKAKQVSKRKTGMSISLEPELVAGLRERGKRDDMSSEAAESRARRSERTSINRPRRRRRRRDEAFVLARRGRGDLEPLGLDARRRNPSRNASRATEGTSRPNPTRPSSIVFVRRDIPQIWPDKQNGKTVNSIEAHQ